MDLLFIINVAWIVAHELDAILRHEWRLFFFLKPLSDAMAYQLFTALHIPLIVLILSQLHVYQFQMIFDLLLIAHAGLHWSFRKRPLYEFNNGFSNIWIFGAVPLAMLHLLLLIRG
jgi:hypothetical protein